MQLEALFLRMDSTDSKSVPCEMVAEFITPWYQLEKQLRGGTADHHELGALRMQIFNAAFSLEEIGGQICFAARQTMWTHCSEGFS